MTIPDELKTQSSKPTGQAYPALKMDPDDKSSPIPVVMSSGFFWKMMGILLIPTIGAMSAGISMYWQMDIHMGRKDIHPPIADLETKKDATVARLKLVEDIKDKVQLEIGEVRLQQKQQIDKLSDRLEERQIQGMKKILQEFKRTRNTVSKAHTHD